MAALQVSSGCREVLSSLLEPLPQQRASVEDVLSHLWFTQVCAASCTPTLRYCTLYDYYEVMAMLHPA